MSGPSAAPLWPSLNDGAVSRTVDYVHRIAQIAGKFTLDRMFERSWGHVVLPVTPRGFISPLLRSGSILFTIEFALLDAEAIVVASNGRVAIPLGAGSVAAFYRRFVDAIATLGIESPRTTMEVEIAEPKAFETDIQPRPFEPIAARAVWGALAGAAEALCAYQAPYFGPRPPVGIMWGGFDLSATRYNGRSKPAPDGKPIFQQNGMNSEEVAIGFAFGDNMAKPSSFYAYVVPEPDAMSAADFGVPDARWIPSAGLVSLPYEAVRTSPDPHATVVRFADAVYAVAVEKCGWPKDMVGPREAGWFAARHKIVY